MKTIPAILLTLILLVLSAPAEDKHAPSTPEERARLIDIAGKLRTDPLNPSLRSDREWATIWLIEIPDVTLKLCSLPWESKYKYSGELMAAKMTSMAAFAFQHPERTNDDVAVTQAGLEGALEAYKSVLTSNPKAKSKAMEELVATEAKGVLTTFVQQEWTRCNSKP